MTRQFAHPSGKRLLGEVRDLFLKKDIFFSLAPHIVFVCGGTKRSAFRSRFLTYLGKKSPKVQPFLAEKAVKNLLSHSAPEVVNLANFEDLIASVFNSVLIFPESPGSIAELGFFSNSEKIQTKILVANDMKFQDDSFINVGPIALVGSKSVYGPTIHLDRKNPDFATVVKRLLKFQKAQIQRDRFRYNKYKKLESRENPPHYLR